jgi:hypothetical protein
VRVGVLVTGDAAVRAAHSLNAHPGVDQVVVIGPAKSRNFKVVENADGCDLLLGTGPDAPGRARSLGVPLIWDGDQRENGVAVWGASPVGVAVALAERETDSRIVAVAHPGLGDGNEHLVRFPDPIGSTMVDDTVFGGRAVATGKSKNQFAACLAVGADRSVTIIEDGNFLDGVALAAGAVLDLTAGKPVWEQALDYLQTARAMGLVMAES